MENYLKITIFWVINLSRNPLCPSFSFNQYWWFLKIWHTSWCIDWGYVYLLCIQLYIYIYSTTIDGNNIKKKNLTKNLWMSIGTHYSILLRLQTHSTLWTRTWEMSSEQHLFLPTKQTHMLGQPILQFHSDNMLLLSF